MKFERLTSEGYGARNAGYTLDLDYPREYDKDLLQEAEIERGERFVDNALDSFNDFDGDLYRGDDGNLYAVSSIWFGNSSVPVIWQRVKKA